MVDFGYLAGTTAFFALMFAYVSFCERLGRTGDVDTTAPEPRP